MTVMCTDVDDLFASRVGRRAAAARAHATTSVDGEVLARRAAQRFAAVQSYRCRRTEPPCALVASALLPPCRVADEKAAFVAAVLREVALDAWRAPRADPRVAAPTAHEIPRGPHSERLAVLVRRLWDETPEQVLGDRPIQHLDCVILAADTVVLRGVPIHEAVQMSAEALGVRLEGRRRGPFELSGQLAADVEHVLRLVGHDTACG